MPAMIQPAAIRSASPSRGIALLRLVAGLIGVDFDALRQRDRSRRRRRMAVTWVAAAAMLAVLGTLGASAIHNRRIAALSQGDVEEKKTQLEVSERERLQQEYLSDMRSLPKLWNEDRIDLIRARLAKYDPNTVPQSLGDQRHFEWYYWHRRAYSAAATWEAGSRVTSLAWSPDAKTLYATGVDGRLLSWDVESEKLNIVRDAGSSVATVVADPVVKRLALLSDPRTRDRTQKRGRA